MTDIGDALLEFTFGGQEILDSIGTFLADYEVNFAQEWLSEVVTQQTDGPLAALIEDYLEGDITVEQLYDRARTLDWSTSNLGRQLEEAFWGGGRVTADTIGMTDPHLLLDWGASNPWVRQAFDDHTVSLVAVNQGTNDGVASLVATAVEEAWRTERLANEIRAQVGLLPSHVIAVNNYNRTLTAQGVSPFTVQQRTRAYAARLRQYRADMIAATEVASATNRGQHEFWRRVSETGLLPPRTMRTWITSKDELVCEICGPLQSSEAPIGGTWLTVKGTQITAPPAHPMCRCTTGLVFHDELGKAVPYSFVKHEGGGHDQKTHGNWARGRVNMGPLAGALPGKAIVHTPFSGKRHGEIYDILVEWSSSDQPGSRWRKHAQDPTARDEIMQVLNEFPPHLRPRKVVITSDAPLGGGFYDYEDRPDSIMIHPALLLPTDTTFFDDRISARYAMPPFAPDSVLEELEGRIRSGATRDRLDYVVLHETTHYADRVMHPRLDEYDTRDRAHAKRAEVITQWQLEARPLFREHFAQVRQRARDAEMERAASLSGLTQASAEAIAEYTAKQGVEEAVRADPLWYTAVNQGWEAWPGNSLKDLFGPPPVWVGRTEAVAEAVTLTKQGNSFPGGDILLDWWNSKVVGNAPEFITLPDGTVVPLEEVL